MKTKITIIASLLLLSASLSFGQKKDWGIGVKLGDPVGFSLKKYMKNDNALEFIMGSCYPFEGHNSRYYNNDPGYRFDNSTSPFPLAFQLRYLIQKDIKAVDGLQWYFGAGAQFRIVRYRYYYDHNYVYYGYYNNGKNGYYANSYYTTGFGAGVDGVGGAEYSFKNLPFSVAADVNLFIGVSDGLFMVLPQGGVTARYNF